MKHLNILIHLSVRLFFEVIQIFISGKVLKKLPPKIGVFSSFSTYI